MLPGNRSNVDILQSPFPALRVQPLTDNFHFHPSMPYTLPNVRNPPRPHPAGGARGLRQLISHSNGLDKGSLENNRAAQEGIAGRCLSSHRGGLLILWDSESYEPIASKSHGKNTSVVEAVVTSQHVITRVECSEKSDVLEEDLFVYILCRQTLVLQHLLKGHTMRVTAMAVDPIRPSIIVTAALDCTMALWNTSKKNPSVPVCSVDTKSQGIISLLCFRGGYLIGAGAEVPVSVWRVTAGDLQLLVAQDRDPEASATAMYALDSSTAKGDIRAWVGSTNGYVKEWIIRPDRQSVTLVKGVQNKLHRASVSIIAHDAEVNILFSVSVYDGIAACNRKTDSFILDTRAGGISSLLIDATNKYAIVGNDKGSVWVLHYAEFAAGTAKEMPVVWQAAPHTASVSSIVLEVAEGNMWERLITSSIDGSFTIMNYGGQKLLASFDTHGNLSRELCTQMTVPTQSIAAANCSGNQKQVNFFDARTMRGVTVGLCKPQLTMKSNISVIHWDTASKLLWVATEDEHVHAYTFMESDGSWVAAGSAPFPRYMVKQLASSVSDGPMWVALQSTRHQGGALAALQTQHGTTTAGQFVAGQFVMEHTFPVAVADCSGEAPRMSYRAAVMTANRAIVIIAMTPKSATSIEIKPLAEVTPPRSATPGMRNSLSMSVWRTDEKINIAWPDGISIKRATGTELANGLSIQPQSSFTLDVHPVLGVTQMHHVGQAMVDLAIQYAGVAGTYLVNAVGDVLYHVGHSGTVTRKNYARRQNLAISFTLDDAYDDSKQETAMAACSEARYLVLAYADGLLQLLDTSSVFIFARWWVPQGKSVRQVWCFQDRVVALVNPGTLVTFPVRRRVILDVV